MLTVLVYILSLAAAGPIELTWQARVLDAAGEPIQGTRTLHIHLYDGPSADGELVWDDTFTASVVDGFTTVVLGSGDEVLTTEALSRASLWVETRLDDEIVGTRQRLSHVPRAVIADGVPVVVEPDDADCAGQPGRLTWSTSAQALLVCDGTAWRGVSFGTVIGLVDGARRYLDGTAARSCKGYLNPVTGYLYQGETGDGAYWVDPDGAGGNAPFRTHCDMTTDGGGWTRLADIGSTTLSIVASTYTNGTGSYGATNHVIQCSRFHALSTQPVMRVRMGAVTDFFRPTSSHTLCQMLSSYTRHQWSASPDGTFVVPGYYFAHLGGSSVNWPQSSVAGDNRRYLSFWGGGGSQSGCCHTNLSDNSGEWERTFDVYIRE